MPLSVTASEAAAAGQKSIEHLTGVLLACSTAEAALTKERLEASRSADRAMLSTLNRARSRRLLETFDEKKAAALFRRFVRHGTWHTPTLTALRVLAYADDESLTGDPRLKYIPPFVRREWNPRDDFRFRNRNAEDVTNARLMYRKNIELVGAMHRAGVKILAGTDLGNPYLLPGFSLHDELGLLVKAGFTPLEALQAATRNPAEFLGLLDSLGTVEEGKLADLVLLGADPLAAIANTQKIEAVIVGGRLIDHTELQQTLDGAASAAGAQ